MQLIQNNINAKQAVNLNIYLKLYKTLGCYIKPWQSIDY